MPKSMFLCPVIFGDDFKISLEGSRKDTDEKKWPDIKNVPGIFIHEMLHWLDLKPASEHGMFYPTSKHLLRIRLVADQARNIVTDEKVVVPGDGGSIVAYGMLAVWLLAGNNPGDTVNAGRKESTLTNADSYNVFATMVYIPGADFTPY